MTTFDTILSYIRSAVPELTNNSGTSLEVKIASALAPIIDNTLTEITNSEQLIQNTITLQKYGHAQYYTDKSKAYQVGVDMAVDANGNYYYSSINTALLLIKQAAFEIQTSGSTQMLSLKVAAFDSDGNKLRALTSGIGSEMEAFNNYFKYFEIPGLPVSIISLGPNIYNFSATVSYYNQYNLGSITDSVLAGIINFRNNFEFNGELFVNDLEGYLKSTIPGIRNVSLINNTITNTNGTVIPFTNSITLQSGYFNYPDNIATAFTYDPI